MDMKDCAVIAECGLRQAEPDLLARTAERLRRAGFPSPPVPLSVEFCTGGQKRLVELDLLNECIPSPRAGWGSPPYGIVTTVYIH
jgi:hypothetical protein